MILKWLKGTDDKIQTKQQKSWFENIRQGLKKSSSRISNNISGVFNKRKLDAKAIEDLQDILIMSDIGVETSELLTENIAKTKFDKEISDEEIKIALAEEINNILKSVSIPLEVKKSQYPHIILMVGVNGTGKTTTIGKLSNKFSLEGNKVMLAAGDTFRAAAVEQLKIWGDRTGSQVISHSNGSDVGALVYDAVKQAIDDKVDVLLIDTAGRLHNKKGLMDELGKVNRVIRKLIPEPNQDSILVLDGTVGQNALEQVKHFKDCIDISGIIMNKLDGTAKGGVLVNIANKYKLPIHAIGVGEQIEDLYPFDSKIFSCGLMGIDLNNLNSKEH